jgi:hypothetical protein
MISRTLLMSSLLLLQAVVQAQSSEQQIVTDAAAALGGRERILAARTLLVEGGGHDLNFTQSLRFDELGVQSDVWQIRNYRRAYDLSTGRARFEATREAQYPFFQGEAAAPLTQAITAIDDEGVVKDSAMTINLYHLRDNTHADSMLLIYFPAGRVLTQADVYMPNDKRNVIAGEPLGHAPRLRNLWANITMRKLAVDEMVPLHGEHVPYSQFLDSVVTMTQFVPAS